MKSPVKYSLAFVLVMILAVTAAVSALAVNTGLYVHELDQVFSAAESSSFEQRASLLSEEYGVDVLILVSDETGGRGNGAFAEAFYRDNGFGQSAKGSGIVFFINSGDNSYYICTLGNARSIFPDDIVAVINYNISNDIKFGNYYDGTTLFLNNVEIVLAGKSLDTPVGNPQKIYDRAGLFTQDDIDYLQEIASEMLDRYGFDVVIVTTDDTGGLDEIEYADEFYYKNGFGTDGARSGIIFLIDMQHRKYRISTIGHAKSIYSDSDTDHAVSYIANSMKSGEYGQAAREFLYIMDTYTDSNEYTPSVSELAGRVALISSVAGFGIALIIMLCLLAAHNKAMKVPAAHHYAQRPLNLTSRNDQFHSTHTTRVRRSEDSSSGGGGSSSGGGGGGGSSGGSSGSF